MKTGYQYLAIMRYITKHKDRIDFIIRSLEEMNLYPEVDNYKYDKVNIYIKFHGTSDKAILFLAHHDTSNPNSENCQDNTASVCNLLHLCSILKDTPLKQDVIVVFTDEEEKVSFTASGGATLARRINSDTLFGDGTFCNIQKTINLELTGRGKIVWADTDTDILGDMERYLAKTPFNDAAILRYHKIPSVCVGIFTMDELRETVKTGMNKIWKLCHSEKDSFSKVSEEDMKNFVENTLIGVIK
jgi:hypothetical protein